MEKRKKHSGAGEKGAFDIINSMLDLPPGALSRAANINLSGNKEATVDGCRGILEYSDTVVRLNTGNNVVRFLGRGLEIRSLTADQAVVTGYIVSVDFGT